MLHKLITSAVVTTKCYFTLADGSADTLLCNLLAKPHIGHTIDTQSCFSLAAVPAAPASNFATHLLPRFTFSAVIALFCAGGIVLVSDSLPCLSLYVHNNTYLA